MDFNDLCSFYFNVREQRCIEMSLEEFVNYICNGRWKSTVEMYHRLMAEGDKSKAKRVEEQTARPGGGGVLRGKPCIEEPPHVEWECHV